MLSERMTKSMDDAEAGLSISWPIDEWATEVAKYERVARAADTMIDKLFPIANMRKDVDSPEAQEMFAALADLGVLRG